MRQFIILIGLLLFTLACSKDTLDELNILPPDLDWESTLYNIYTTNILNNDSIITRIHHSKYAIESTSDNGFVIAVNGYIEKYNSMGESLWNKTFDSYINYIEQLSNDEYLIGGEKDGAIWVAKTDNNWNILWERIVQSHSTAELTAIAETTDGLIIGGVTGNSNSTDVWLIKLDDNGNELWEHNLEHSGADYLKDIEITRDGNILTVGHSNSMELLNAADSYDAWVTNLDKDGTLIWEKLYGGLDLDEGYGIQENDDGDFILLAYYQDDIRSGTSLSILDNDGEIKFHNHHETSYFSVFDELPNGDFLLTGGFSTYYAGYFYNAITKLDQNGARVWQRNYNNLNIYSDIETITGCKMTDGSYILLSRLDDNYNEIFAYRLHKTKPE